MLSVSYVGKNAYSAGKTSGVIRGGAPLSVFVNFFLTHHTPYLDDETYEYE